jgi:hypothetical protein
MEMATSASDRLPGATDPNAWYFSRIGEEGPLPNPVGHTFPFLTHGADRRWRLVGTGFYVNDSGFFVTSRHVIDEVFQNGCQILPLVILHFHSESGLFGPSEFQIRPIAQCWLSDVSDVAFGTAATATNKVTGKIMNNWTWTLSWSVPRTDSIASTYAFPDHLLTDEGSHILFSPSLYGGRILSAGEFRDHVMIPFPYLEVDFRIHGAASGGPILCDGRVVGINCTEWPENIDHPPGPGFGAQSRCLGSAFLDDIVLPTENLPRRVTFYELVEAGCINVENYEPAHLEEPFLGSIVRFTLPHSATPPRVSIKISA